MSDSRAIDETVQRYRDARRMLRSALSEGRRLDDIFCANIDSLRNSHDPLVNLSLLRSHALQSARYHGELEAIIGQFGAELTRLRSEYLTAKDAGDAQPGSSGRNRKRMRKTPDWISIPIEIIRIILSNLTASDASTFLSTTGLRWTVDYKVLEPFLAYRRETPWDDLIQSYLSHGHKVLMIGSDVDQLHMRIHRPLRYWRSGMGKRKLQLWLAIRVSPHAPVQLAKERRKYPNATFSLEKDGRVDWTMAGGDPSPPTFITFEGKWHPAHAALTNWQTYDTGNRTELLCQQDWQHEHRWHEIPRVRICPTVEEGGHFIRRWNGITECNPICPGVVHVGQETLLRLEHIPSDFALPFIDLGTGQRGLSSPMERESGRIDMDDLDAKGLLFCVEFSCLCNLVQVNHRLHGIRQVG